MRPRILIAGRQAHLRSALRIFLRSGCGCEVACVAGDSDQLMAEVQRHEPDVVLLDWSLLGQSTVEVLPLLREASPRSRVIVLSGQPQRLAVAKAAGADAIFDLGEPPSRLWALLQEVQASLETPAPGKMGDHPPSPAKSA
jgi:DNA-binding NarL/FixJ family response regulator